MTIRGLFKALMAGLICALLARGGGWPRLNVAQASTLAQSSKGDQKPDKSNGKSLPKDVTIPLGSKRLQSQAREIAWLPQASSNIFRQFDSDVRH
jgi:hypothetical protein